MALVYNSFRHRALQTGHDDSCSAGRNPVTIPEYRISKSAYVVRKSFNGNSDVSCRRLEIDKRKKSASFQVIFSCVDYEGVFTLMRTLTPTEKAQ